ncbi:MAG TPA: GTA-gp10 family protein [Alphaproteobacteria bacterium]|nr:GTA-gp10 family protein [Alphaproteobacteria bacterium]
MANPHRGEVEIILAGEKFTLLPSFEACVEIEQKTGTGIYHYARRCLNDNFGLKDAEIIFAAGIRAKGEHKVPPNLANMIFENGITTSITPSLIFLGFLVGGNNSSKEEATSGEAKAA